MKYIQLSVLVLVSLVLVGCGAKTTLPEVTAPSAQGVKDVVNNVADTVKDGAEDVIDAVDGEENLDDLQEQIRKRNEEINAAAEADEDGWVVPATDFVDETDFGAEETGPITKIIDSGASSLNWEAGKIIPGGDHYGTVAIKNGSAVYEEGELVSAEATIDMTTIASEAGGGLDGHLKNEDFFDVANHPEAMIAITSTSKSDEGMTATADLTIKGITNEITFPIVADGERYTANFSIDRTLWDIKYGSAKFFDDLKDKAIKDMIDFEVNIAYE